MVASRQFEEHCERCGCELEIRVEGAEYDLLGCPDCLVYCHRPKPLPRLLGPMQVVKAERRDP